MKYLILFSILVTVAAGKASASDFNAIKCGEFKYTDIVRIDVDLETSRYVVDTLWPIYEDGNQMLGRGRI